MIGDPKASRSAASRFLVAAGLVAAATFVAKILQRTVALPDPAMVFLTAVLISAVLSGLGASLFASTVSFLVYDFLFVEPVYTFSVTKPQDLVSLCVFFVAAVLASHLTARVRDRAVAIERARVDAVLEEKAKTEQVMEASEDGLIVLDPAGVVAHVNEVACAILGVERSKVLGARFDDLATTHSHYLRLREAVREFLGHSRVERERVEITLFLRGRDHHYMLRPTPFRGRDGSAAGLILALQDVTYLRDQEARRENLVATLSHELGTPLTSLRMALELLRQRAQALDTDQRELVDAAHDDVLRLQDVAQRFLNLARTRAMSIALERHCLDLGEMASRVVKLFALQAREKGILLEVQTSRSETIAGDETKLTWALSNLIANALRYTPSGGRVGIDIEASDGSVLVSVRDTGPGIPPEQREWIFERFTQSPGAGQVGSAGLGLAIVRDIVQAHSGRIHLESEVGKGTRFTLELPRG